MAIREKLTLGIVAILTAIALIVATIGVMAFLEDKKEDNLKEAYIIKDIISQDMAKLVLLNSVYSAVDINNKLKSFSHLNSLILYNLKNQPIYSIDNKIKNKNLVNIKVPIAYKGSKVGYMKASFSYITIKEAVKKYMTQILSIYLLVLLITYVFSYYYANIFTKPIFKLIDFLDSIDLSSLNKRITNNYKDEFGKLYNQVNKMLDNLKKSLDLAEQSKKEALFSQTHDSVTGLLNKDRFVEEFIQKAKNNKYHLIAIVDIKSFHRINDIFSHKIGDEVLFNFANFLRENMRDALLAKIGSDEFVISYINLPEAKLKKLTKKFIEMLNSEQEFNIEGEKIILSYRIAINSISNIDIQQALKETDMALNEAKRTNQDVVFYVKSLEDEVLKKFTLKEEIEKAIINKEFEAFYQLQYHSKKGVYGAEALVRWNHPTRGVLSPFFFLPVAEESEQIVKIGDFMLEASIAQLAKWQQENKKWKMSVNVHIKQFNNRLINQVKELIKKYEIDPQYLTIEILENFFFENSEDNMAIFLELKKLGISIAIDDFGTGFSSYQYIKNLPIDEIKIDQNFVFDMFKNQIDISIIKSIIFLAKEVKIELVAEGVESERHYKMLKKLGCEIYQGYYFSKPITIDEFMKLASEIESGGGYWLNSL